ncbi:hypothetical protein [Herbiconiux sp. VKM Ac-2851]|uniref:hypothetical protein n=1 Tax=Herbiconiux sp. VKM Ac-2851 TaxID=2739025 RepID=UPI00156494DE|nr:hypothetical protein [Herbiconiux sp. VKM Ac-2851]NQX36275.1 hypothetical protein [Herbiconiux sp. VKM Ac-2851]
MPAPAPDASGRLAYFVAADVAAKALSVSKLHVYKIARSEKWRHTPTHPRGFLMEDVARTAARRKASS